MSVQETYIFEQGYRRPTNPPRPTAIILRPETIEEIVDAMGWEEVDAESFLTLARQYGTAMKVGQYYSIQGTSK